jgi:hypothetical protein
MLRSAPNVEPPFLVRGYRTSLNLGDSLALRDEATAFWPRFLPMVKRAGVWKAVVQANGEAVHIGGFFYQRRYTFIVLRDTHDQWYFRGDLGTLSDSG